MFYSLHIYLWCSCPFSILFYASTPKNKLSGIWEIQPYRKNKIGKYRKKRKQTVVVVIWYSLKAVHLDQEKYIHAMVVMRKPFVVTYEAFIRLQQIIFCMCSNSFFVLSILVQPPLVRLKLILFLCTKYNLHPL